MTFFVIWIDRAKAKIFQFSQEKMERKTLRSHLPDHHTHRQDSNDLEQKERRFFQGVSDAISPNSQILILGPGIVKHHFQNYLNEHYPILSKMVVACETVDHPTDPQIAAQALKYFKIAKNYAYSL